MHNSKIASAVSKNSETLDESLRERFEDILECRPSPIHGSGIFARVPFKKGAVVFAWQGAAVNYPKMMKGLAAQPKEVRELIEHQSTQLAGHIIHFRSDTQVTDFLNHSRAPNIILHCGIGFALCDIQAGEELTADYRYILLPHEELLTNDGETVRAAGASLDPKAPADMLASLRETTALVARLLGLMD
jgi:SET domain-containing protein